MGRSAGMSLSHIQALEKDEFSPTKETVAKLAKALGMPTNELLEIRDALKVETDLTLLLREAGHLDDDQRARLMEVATELLGDLPSSPKKQPRPQKSRKKPQRRAA